MVIFKPSKLSKKGNTGGNSTSWSLVITDKGFHGCKIFDLEGYKKGKIRKKYVT